MNIFVMYISQDNILITYNIANLRTVGLQNRYFHHMQLNIKDNT